MKIYLVLAGLIFINSCSSKPEPVLIGDIPEELETKLTYQEGHIPYYFPSIDEFGELIDGTYIGELKGGFIDRGEVSLTIENGEISNVEIVDITFWAPKVRSEKREAEFFRGLSKQIVDKQDTVVDVVSGATGSSHVFRICITRALWKASLMSDPMAKYSPY